MPDVILKPANFADTDKPASRFAPMQEIFSSVQGEGPYVGERQLFVRFAHCHLKCAYCDTTMTTADGKCHVEQSPGSPAVDLLDNPVSIEAMMTAFKHVLPQARHKAISFTGGEPLLYHQFLAQLFPTIKDVYGERPWLYLETSGTQPEFLQSVLPWTDVIAMDFKLPSTTKEAPRYKDHAEFLKMAQTNRNCELFIKLIFDETTTDEEWDCVKATLNDSTLPIFLQPVTDLKTNTIQVPAKAILKAEETLSGFFHNVRVVPQTHKMVQVR